jgi:hypothetical protein
MKNILICILSSFAIFAHAQSFEGTIRWSFKCEIADPATKQKMEHAQSQMSDPKNQAQMKEMEEKMKDPQFQQMMEQNPQLKAQMEKVVAGLKTGGGIESMMPKAFVIKTKNGSSLTKIEGGMMESEILYLKEKDQKYSIHRDAKTFSTLSKSQNNGKEEKPQVKVTKTKETAKILNYTCTKYIVESTATDGKSIKTPQFIWTTTEIKDIDQKSLANSSVGRGQNIMYDGIEGIPMRVEMKTKEMNMTMEVAEIIREKLSNSDFAIPLGFTETKSTEIH